MAYVKRYWPAVAFFLVFGTAIAMRESRPATVQAAPGPTNVIVTNFPATQAVSGTVNVGNFPATQAVSGTVGITGTPNVNVTDTTPLPVTVANNPALQPVQASTSCTIPAGLQQCSPAVLISGVSAGQRLVIEFVSATVALPTGEHLESFDIATTGGGNFINHFLAPGYSFDNGTTTAWYALSRDLTVYADGGSGVTVQCVRLETTSTPDAICNFTISGYLVNTP